jgi:hypothetical protein
MHGDCFNCTMPRFGISGDERRAMLRFEALFEEWRLACERLLQAETLAINESLGHPDGTVSASRKREVEQARADVWDALRRAMAARDAFGS